MTQRNENKREAKSPPGTLLQAAINAAYVQVGPNGRRVLRSAVEEYNRRMEAINKRG